MKAKHFGAVSDLMKALGDIEADIDRCARGLGVTICGTYQNDMMVDLVRPHVLAELRRRAAEVQEKLKAYGVSFERTGIFG